MFLKIIKSAQLWFAVLGLAQTLLLNYLGVPAEIWASIDAILVVLIGLLTGEEIKASVKQLGVDFRLSMLEAARLQKEEPKQSTKK